METFRSVTKLRAEHRALQESQTHQHHLAVFKFDMAESMEMETD